MERRTTTIPNGKSTLIDVVTRREEKKENKEEKKKAHGVLWVGGKSWN